MHLSTIAFNSPGTRTHIPAHKFHDTLECTLLVLYSSYTSTTLSSTRLLFYLSHLARPWQFCVREVSLGVDADTWNTARHLAKRAPCA